MHVGSGIYMQRESNGAVRISVRDEQTHTRVIREAVIEAPEWQAVTETLNTQDPEPNTQHPTPNTQSR